MLDRVVDIILSLASLAPQAIWGVMIQFFAFKRGFEGSIGSVETTSAPRPPTFPDSRAEARASSSIRPPRAVLMINTPSFISEMVSLFIIFFVFSFSGAWSDITSEFSNSSFFLTWLQPSPSM